MKKLESLFESKVEIPRIKVGKTQTIETLINEEVIERIEKCEKNYSKLWNHKKGFVR